MPSVPCGAGGRGGVAVGGGRWAGSCRRTPVIDLHCHLLPNIDDGSRSAKRSVEVLERMAADGVVGVVLTPHVKASDIESDAEHCLEVRERAFNELTAHSSQLTAHGSQLTAHSTQLTAHSSQLTAHRAQLPAHNSQRTAHSSPLTAGSSRRAAHSALPSCTRASRSC